MAKSKIGGSGRQKCSPFEFKSVIKQKFNDKYIEVPAKNTSKIHYDCGNIQDIKDEMVFVCKHCHIEYDRDINAAKNILKLGLASLASTDAPNVDLEPLATK
jgi:transposase